MSQTSQEISSKPAANRHFSSTKKGLLQLLDYIAVGLAAHYCFDHTAFGGLVFPTPRRVVRRPPSGPLANGPTAVLIQITDVVFA